MPLPMRLIFFLDFTWLTSLEKLTRRRLYQHDGNNEKTAVIGYRIAATDNVM